MPERLIERVRVLGSSKLEGNKRKGTLSVECLKVECGCDEQELVSAALGCDEYEKRQVIIDGVERNIWFNIHGLSERGLGEHETVIFTGVNLKEFPVVGDVLIESEDMDCGHCLFQKGLRSGEIRIGMVMCSVNEGKLSVIYH